MKISEILNEVEIKHYSRNELTFAQAVDFIKKNCSEAFEKHGSSPIYRGFNSLSEHYCYLLDPSTGKRGSQNTYNHYTDLMDSSPYWQQYPKRSRSFICSTDVATAGNYGEVYGIYPVNGTKIGVCPDHDIWNTEIPRNKYHLYSWEDIPSFLNQIGVESGSVQDMDNQLTTEPELATHLEQYKRSLGLPDNVTVDQIIPDIVELTKPELCGFQLIDTNTPLPKEDRELWFSGPCIAVPLIMVADIFR